MCEKLASGGEGVVEAEWTVDKGDTEGNYKGVNNIVVRREG